MLDGFRRRRIGIRRAPAPRRRLGGCLLWLLGLIAALIILSLLVRRLPEGHQGGPGRPRAPFPAAAVTTGGGR